jgi:CIC family chloride channel protein
MMFEMTANGEVIAPLMLASAIAYFVSRSLRPDSIYASHRPSGTHAPALTMAGDLLRQGPPTVVADSSTAQLAAVFTEYRWQHCYVVDDAGRFLGAVSLHDFAPYRSQAGDAQPWPSTLLRVDYPRVNADTPAWQVMETFASHPGERLPVLNGAGLLQGYVTKTDLVLMFRERLAAS